MVPVDTAAARTPLAARIAQAFPTLAVAPPATLERIARAAIYRKVQAGTVMFSERSPCGGFPLILSGSVRVLQRYPNGRELQLYRVKPGESCLLLGSCLLGHTEYDASGIAETDVELLILPPPLFHALIALPDLVKIGRHDSLSHGHIFI